MGRNKPDTSYTAEAVSHAVSARVSDKNDIRIGGMFGACSEIQPVFSKAKLEKVARRIAFRDMQVIG